LCKIYDALSKCFVQTTILYAPTIGNRGTHLYFLHNTNNNVILTCVCVCVYRWYLAIIIIINIIATISTNTIFKDLNFFNERYYALLKRFRYHLPKTNSHCSHPRDLSGTTSNVNIFGSRRNIKKNKHWEQITIYYNTLYTIM